MLEQLQELGLEPTTTLNNTPYFSTPSVSKLLNVDRRSIVTMLKRRATLFGEVKKVKNKHYNRSSNEYAILISEEQVYLLAMVMQRERAIIIRKKMAKFICLARANGIKPKISIIEKIRIFIARLIKAEVQ